MRYPKLFIILLNWNGKQDTLECLASLFRITSPRFQLLVVDNGSRDDSVAAIRKAFPRVPILQTGKNLGFAGGNNAGIEWALSKKAEWILLLNNDTIVDPHFLTAFLTAAKEKPKGKIFGAKIYSYKEPTQIDHLGGYWDPARAEFFSYAQGEIEDDTSFETMQEVDYVCGAALFAHASVFQTIGLLEPRFFLFWEETDFCARAKRKGFEVWTAPQAKIWHKISASFVGGKPHSHYFWWRSRLLWMKRNLPHKERTFFYRNNIRPALLKETRHYLLRSLQALLTHKPSAKKKARRAKAALLGALHYAFGCFGDCPKQLKNQETEH